MVAWRYEIFPLVLKNISPVNVLKNISLVRCSLEHNTRREISYLGAAM